MTTGIVEPKISHKESAAIGMAWATASAILVKLMGFVSQFVLGWMLSKDDFGLYALAISVSSLVVPLQNGGIHKILITRCSEYESLAPDLFKLALVFNLFFMAVIFALAPLSEKLYSAPELTGLLAIIGLSIPLRTPGAIIRTKLLNDLRFKENAKISTASSFVRNCSTIVFALAGFGPMSFVLPLLLVALFENFAYWNVVRLWPRGGTLSWKIFKEVFLDARWIMLGALVLTLSLQSDYLVIGLLEDKATLGAYFFAFQLSISFSVLFTVGIDSVMLPSFSRLADDAERQNSAFLKSFGMLSFLVAPVAVGTALFMEPLVHHLWAGKWDVAIISTQLLLLSLLTRMPLALTQSFLESKGHWKSRSYIQAVDTAGIMIAAAVGAWFGGLLLIAISISLYRFAAAFIFSMIGCSVVGIGRRLVIELNGVVVLVALLAGMVAFLIAGTIVPQENYFTESFLSFSLFMLFFGCYSYGFGLNKIKDIVSLFNNLKIRHCKHGL